MATYRERRMRKAERLRGWAEGRDAKSDAARAASDRISDMIPMGQPILVGHHSEKRHRRDIDRIQNGMRATIEHGRKADEMRGRADEIERQAAGAIYDDDPDAIDRLREKIAGLEATREERKAENAAYRKEHRAELKGLSAYERSQAVPWPSYSITNMTGNIGRLRERLTRLERAGTAPDRIITARFASSCADCGAELAKGDAIRYTKAKGARCLECQEGGE